MYSKCLVCQKEGEDRAFNNLPMKKCPECGLVWRANFDLSPDYYQNKLINLKSEKMKERIDNSRQRVKLFKKYLDLSNLCDVGCGEGTLLKVLAEDGYQNLVGIEPSETQNDFAVTNKLIIKKGNLNDLSVLADSNIKTVTMFHLLEHLAKPEEALKLIYDYLPQGGFLIMETPDFESYSFKKSGYKHKLIYDEHLFYFNEKNLKEILAKIGFRVVAIGRRCFNQDNLSIKESLFRLGLIKNSEPQKSPQNLAMEQKSEEPKATAVASLKKRVIVIVKNIIRKFLSSLVMILGRLDYLWVVARKD